MILYGLVAYLVGLWLGPFLSLFPLTLLGFLLGCSLFLTWFEQRRILSFWEGILVFVLVVVGMGHAHGAAINKLESPLLALSTESPVVLQGVIVAPVRQNLDGIILLVDVTHALTQGRFNPIGGRIRLTWRRPDIALVYGDQVRMTARLREPYGTRNPGGFHYGNYLKRKGIQAVATVYGPNAVIKQRQGATTLWGSVMGSIDRWRQAIHSAASTSLPAPSMGLFVGMIIGEQSSIGTDIRDAFMASGTVHILSISGSHLGLLAFVVFAGVRWSIRRMPASWLERVSLYLTATQCAVLMTVPIVTFYMLLAGAEMATVRAWIMIMVCCLALWLGRET